MPDSHVDRKRENFRFGRLLLDIVLDLSFRAEMRAVKILRKAKIK